MNWAQKRTKYKKKAEASLPSCLKGSDSWLLILRLYLGIRLYHNKKHKTTQIFADTMCILKFDMSSCQT